MANLYIFFDKRSPRKDGTGTLKLALTHRHKTVYESLGIRVKPDEWDAGKCQVVTRPDKKFQNVILRKRLADATMALQRIMLRRDFATFSARDIMTMLIRGTDTNDAQDNADYVLPVYRDYISLLKKATTKGIYRTSLNNLIKYEPDIDNLRFSDITVAWLRRYQQWLTETNGMSVNGANVYLRNLRTIFNYALENELTAAHYPFKSIDMATTDPDKRVAPYDKFLRWVDCPIDESLVPFRDLFLLAFYLCGIRPIDLLTVKKDQIREGRLVYWPQKLNGKTKLSVKIEPEAQAIINKYSGQELMLNFMEGRSDYKAFGKRWNRALRMVGTGLTIAGADAYTEEVRRKRKSGVIPYISAYHARRCWSTYAYNILGQPMDVVSQALGHKSGLRVTNFYVKRDAALADKANRDLIDRLHKDLAELRKKGSGE
jgi:integrase